MIFTSWYQVDTVIGSHEVIAQSEEDARRKVQLVLEQRMRVCSEQLGRVSDWKALPEE